MIKKYTIVLSNILLLLVFICAPILYAQNGAIKGVIKDVQTKNPLPYANIILLKTSLGTASDENGNYLIQNVPLGKYTLKISYIGYNNQEISVDVKPGKTLVHNIMLVTKAIQGQTVTVTAQAEGQTKAINEQLNSLSIKNVVSAAKLQELPDANAAESVSRLPGVSLIRTGGEGAQVVIRGLSPQYNQITIDGVEMASDVSSSNDINSTDANQADVTGNLIGDRGMDLSMICLVRN